MEGTNIVDFPKDFPYYQNHYIWDIGDLEKEDITVTFRYDNTYPFTFQVTPSDGNILRSGSVGGNDLLSNICVQMWKFTYDVSYPVLVKVKDEESGYELNTAFTVHLIRNVGNREDTIIARNPAAFPTVSSEKFCSNARIPMTVTTSEVVNSEESGVFFTEPLEEVNVSFTCLKYRCDLGQTEFDFENTGYQAGFTRLFPHCIGGILRAEKQGYKEVWERVLTTNGKQVDLQLTPLIDIPVQNIRIVQHNLEGDDVSTGESVSQKALVMVKVTSQKKDETGKPFHESTFVTSKAGVEVEGYNNLQLLAKADFTYDLEVNVFEDDQFVSGYRGNWTAPWSSLEGNRNVVFHTIGKKDASENENLAFIAGLKSHSAKVAGPEVGQ